MFVRLATLARVHSRAQRGTRFLSTTPFETQTFNLVSWTNPIGMYRQRQLRSNLYQMVDAAAYDIDYAEQLLKSKILSQHSIYQTLMQCNYMLYADKDFRSLCTQTLNTQMQQTTPHVTWLPIHDDNSSVPAFRYMSVNGDFGTPRFVFEFGMPAALINTRSFDRMITKGSIISYAPVSKPDGSIEVQYAIPGRHDMHGFVFGPQISTSLRVGHVINQRFMPRATRFNQMGYVYLIALQEGYNTADALHHGAGYVRDRDSGLKGKKGVSCQEDACEVSAGVYIEKELILGARPVYQNGELGEFIPNPNANQKLMHQIDNFIDMRVYFEITNVREALMYEAMLNPNKYQHENYNSNLIAAMAMNSKLKHRIELEAKREHHVSTLDEHLHVNPAELLCQSGLGFFGHAYLLKHELEKGVIKDAKISFDQRKAGDEDELKKRALNASEQITVAEAPDLSPKPYKNN